MLSFITYRKTIITVIFPIRDACWRAFLDNWYDYTQRLDTNLGQISGQDGTS